MPADSLTGVAFVGYCAQGCDERPGDEDTGEVQ